MKLSPILILLLLVLSVAPALGVETKLPTDDTLSEIVLPRLGLPAFVSYGSELNVTLKADPSVTAREVTISSSSFVNSSLVGLVGYSYELAVTGTFSDSGYAVVEVVVPRSIPSGMYDLTVVESGSFGKRSMTEPHSVVVREAFTEPFRIFWFSDPHIDVLQSQVSNFWSLVWRSNFLKPDLVVITGDVVQSPSEGVFELARELILRMEAPVLLVPGNHDHSGIAPFFSRYFSPFVGSWRFGPLLIAYLDTGDGGIAGVLSDEEVSWLDSTLRANPDASVKIVAFHHPMYQVDDPSNSTVDRVYDVMKSDGVSLVINGHMHEDLVFNGPVFTLVNSNSYPGGRPYSGFRFLNVYRDHVDYLQAGALSSFNLDDFTVSFSQLNDGSSRGERVQVTNGLPMKISGTITMRLAKGDLPQPKVFNASASSSVDLGQYYLVTVPLTLDPHVSYTIVGTTTTTVGPPRISSVAAAGMEGPTARFLYLNASVFDDYVGVQKVVLHYSLDNRSWSDVDAGFFSPNDFRVQLQLEKSVGVVYYYVEAFSWAGTSSSSAVGSISFQGSPPVGGAGTGLDPTLLAAIVIALFSVAILALLIRRRMGSSVHA